MLGTLAYVVWVTLCSRSLFFSPVVAGFIGPVGWSLTCVLLPILAADCFGTLGLQELPR